MSESWLGLLHVITGRLFAERQLRRDPSPLIEELAAAGVDVGDVVLALAWVERFFAGLFWEAPPDEPAEPFTSSGCRTRNPEELVCVSPDAFGLVLRLERDGTIDGAAREEILHRALALGGDEVGEEEIRAISREVLEAAGRDGSAADSPAGRPRNRHLN